MGGGFIHGGGEPSPPFGASGAQESLKRQARKDKCGSTTKLGGEDAIAAAEVFQEGSVLEGGILSHKLKSGGALVVGDF